MPHSFPSPYDANKESRESTASQPVRMRGTVQRDQTSEQWPVPPLPPPQDSLALEEEEYDEGLPPPPWPLSDKSTVGEEQRVVIVIDRMMSELQLMKDSVSSSIAAHTHSHSTPRSLNLPQPRRGPEEYDIRSSTQRPKLYSPISRPQPSIYRRDEAFPTQYPARPHIQPPPPASGRQFSPMSAAPGVGEYRGPASKIQFLVHNDPMEFSRLKLALTNLLPTDASELFKYQILVDHVKLEEACLIADSFINSPQPAAPCRLEEDRCGDGFS